MKSITTRWLTSSSAQLHIEKTRSTVRWNPFWRSVICLVFFMSFLYEITTRWLTSSYAQLHIEKTERSKSRNITKKTRSTMRRNPCWRSMLFDVSQCLFVDPVTSNRHKKNIVYMICYSAKLLTNQVWISCSSKGANLSCWVSVSIWICQISSRIFFNAWCLF